MKASEAIFTSFVTSGRKLSELSLIGLKSGNLSMRHEDYIYVTRKGASLSDLTSGDVLCFRLNEDVPAGASTEAIVHREIYLRTSHNAVAHVHPIYATAVASKVSRFVPTEVEGAYYLKNGVPVVEASKPYGSVELADKVAQALSQSPAVLVRGHGAFVGAHTLEECVELAEILERSAKIWVVERLLDKGETI